MSYHKYVFNDQGLVADFEAMYAAEDKEKFDAWHGSDPRHLRMRLVREVLADYNFNSVLDVGCGKGTQTQWLKKKNNQVIGIDISSTAVAKASIAFPDISFHCGDADAMEILGDGFHLITFQAVLAYCKNWKGLLARASRMAQFCLVAEYIPNKAKGMIKKIIDLSDEFEDHFYLLQKIILNDDFVILFGEAR